MNENIRILGTRGETQYWKMDAALLVTQATRDDLIDLVKEIQDRKYKGVWAWWAEDMGQDGYDLAIQICEACFIGMNPDVKPYCICE